MILPQQGKVKAPYGMILSRKRATAWIILLPWIGTGAEQVLFSHT